MFHRLSWRWQLFRQSRAHAQRPWLHVPPLAAALFAILLFAQVGLAWQRPLPQALAQDLPAPPSTAVLRLFTLADAHAAQRLGLLWLQSYDAQPGVQLALKDIDAQRLLAWLNVLHALAPGSDYAVFLASNVYFGADSETLRRALVPWIRERFVEQPATRWFEMARTAQMVRRHLGDIELAVELVQEIRVHAADYANSSILQLDAFLLEASNDDKAAAVLLAMYLQQGFYRDEHEARFLFQRLQEIHQRLNPPVP